MSCRRELELAGMLGIGVARGDSVRHRLAEDQQRLRHAGDFVLAADGNGNIGFATGDAPHGAA